LGDDPSDEELAKLVREKTNGFLFSNQSSDEILQAISHILNGQNQYAPGLANRMANLLKLPPRSQKQSAIRDLRRAGLTEKQIKVLDALANGQVYKEIATDLSASESAIKYHVKRIQSILGQPTRNDLQEYAQRLGFGSEQ
jgi:DNA-binding NarL/FixJ family response regulator